MIDFLNNVGNTWLPFFLTFQIQNTLFILLVLALLTVFKKSRAAFKKQLTLVALVKTLVPPVLTLPVINATVDAGTLSMLSFTSPIESAVGGMVTETGIHFSGILFLLWFFGAMLIFFFSLYYSFRFHLITRKAEKIVPLKGQIPTQIQIYKDEKVKSPLVFGCFSPKILLPHAWERFDNRLRQSVLIHEYCHVKNGDLWFNGIKLLSLMMHFINPFQWILLHYFEIFSEMTCDDSAVKESGLSRDEYNTLILQSAEALTLPNWLSRTWALSRAFKLLKKRIKYQLNQKEEKEMKRSPLLRLTVLAVLFLAIVPFSWQCNDTTQQKETTTSLAPEKNLAPEIVDANGVYAFFAVDKKPVMKEKARPEYPDEARRKGIEGIVLLVVTIDENGQVAEAVPLEEVPVMDENGEVIETKPVDRIPELEPAAIAAAQKCTFEPALKDGQPVKVKMVVPYRFRLNQK